MCGHNPKYLLDTVLENSTQEGGLPEAVTTNVSWVPPNPTPWDLIISIINIKTWVSIVELVACKRKFERFHCEISSIQDMWTG